jgi:hypothetical protein
MDFSNPEIPKSRNPEIPKSRNPEILEWDRFEAEQPLSHQMGTMTY